MNPERFAFIIIHDLLGFSPEKIADQLTVNVCPTTKGEVEVWMGSQLYMDQRLMILEAFRRHTIKGAVDTLLMANQRAAEFLTDAMDNFSYKPNTRMKAAIEILDRIPQTSKTLRQYVGDIDQSIITEEQLERMTSQIRIDQKAISAAQQDQQEYRENLKNLIDV